MQLISENAGLLSKPKLQKAAVIIGVALIVLIFISTLTPKESAQAPPASESTAETEQRLEARLEELLSEIEGVSSPKVMLTLDSTEEHVYARDSRSGSSSSQDEGGRQGSDDNEDTVVLVGSGSGESALEQSTVLPKVRGVAVVCGGAQDPTIKEKVVNTVSGVLGIGASRVYVTY